MASYDTPTTNAGYTNAELRKVRLELQEANRRAMKNISRVRYGSLDPLWTAGKPFIKWQGDSAVGSDYVSGWESDVAPVPGGSYAFMRDVSGGYFILATSVTQTAFPHQYTNLPLQNGWANYDANWKAPSVTKTVEGIVTVTGLIGGGTVTANTLLFTLPVGFRPDYDLVFGLNANGAVQVLVRPNGEVRIFLAPVANAFLSLTQIVFPAAGVASWKQFGVDSGFTFANGWTNYTLGGYNFGALRMWIEPVSGMVYTQGFITGGTTVNSTAFTGTLPAAYVAERDNLFFTTGGTTLTPGSWRATCATPGTGTAKALVYTHGGNVRYPVMGIYKPVGGMAWTAMSGANGWINYNAAAYTNLAYLKTPGGQVYLHGLVKDGTIAAAITTMPVGARPKAPAPGQGIIGATWSTDTMGRWDIYSSGLVVAAAGISSWFSLDGATWVAEQ